VIVVEMTMSPLQHALEGVFLSTQSAFAARGADGSAVGDAVGAVHAVTAVVGAAVVGTVAGAAVVGNAVGAAFIVE
jgi:hypothetical protein